MDSDLTRRPVDLGEVDRHAGAYFEGGRRGDRPGPAPADFSRPDDSALRLDIGDASKVAPP